MLSNLVVKVLNVELLIQRTVSFVSEFHDRELSYHVGDGLSRNALVACYFLHGYITGVPGVVCKQFQRPGSIPSLSVKSRVHHQA